MSVAVLFLGLKEVTDCGCHSILKNAFQKSSLLYFSSSPVGRKADGINQDSDREDCLWEDAPIYILTN